MTTRYALVPLFGLLLVATSCIEVIATGKRRPRPVVHVEGSASVESSGTPPQPRSDRIQERPADRPSSTALEPPALEPKPVVVGEAHVCALRDGDVHCWGSNYKGMLGLGTTAQPASGMVRGIGDDSEDVVQIAAGDYHTCALTASGQLWCWGSNHVAQLGQGKVTESPINTPQPVRERGIRSIHGGPKNTCSIKKDGSVYCWGQNTVGAIQAGKRPVTRPTSVRAFHGAQDLAIGDYSICALRAGQVTCTGWLAEHNGLVAALPPVTSLTAGWGHACAVADGEVYCWGRNFHGAVGLGDPCAGEKSKDAKSRCRLRQADISHPPQRVPGVVEEVVQVSDTCALLASGKVMCWGSNQGHALAPELPAQPYQTAHTLEGIEGVDELYVGDTFICFLRDHQLSCRGQTWAVAVSGLVRA